MREWLAFIFLGGFAWGASFLWIKIAVQDISPFALVMYRMGFGAAGAWVLIRILKIPLSMTRRQFAGTAFVGAFGLALPISLLSWGETRISSGLAGILNGTVPLWTFIIAHFALHDERITRWKSAGLILGFIGLIILVSPDLDTEGLKGNIWGQLAVVGMAVLYAITSVFTRRYLRDQHPIHTTTIAATTAFFIMLIVAPLMGGRILPQSAITWVATVWLGVIGLSLALWAFYHLLNRWGATRTALVTYVFPVSAVLLGTVFLNEKITWHLLTGGALIIGGIALVSTRRNVPTVISTDHEA